MRRLCNHPDTITIFLMLLLFSPLCLMAQFCLPLNSMYLTSGFGWRKHPVTGTKDFHSGVDLSARFEPVYAIMDGRITSQGFHPILGNFIRLESEGMEVVYGHLSITIVADGQDVRSGDYLGLSGRTGRVTGPHLHLSIKFRGYPINPLRFLKGLACKQ
ncbi:MAG: M23 family metallopeptidase [Pedobacter sp.]|nr:MAG: M23 family metallopeptidase [Pedobacter sp.]